MTQADEYFRRGFNHIQTIKRALQNLRGDAALAFELIQNADDAKEAHHLSFEFAEDALVVSDDGGFESCGDLKARVCPWESDKRRKNRKRRCDFHAFQELAGGSKEDDPTLTGAFGVGFLSVYQVTDQPELLSAGQHWIINETAEETRRIRGCRSRCGHTHVAEGTVFRLPWAGRPSDLRELLGTPPVPAAAQERLWRAFKKAVPTAMVFLHKLETITLKRGDERLTFRREEGDDTVVITGPDLEESWLILEGDFGHAAEALREEHVEIGDRATRVRLAVLPSRRVHGHVYVTLPTQIGTGMPLHIDAAFYPKLDRKGIPLDASGNDNYEAEWNLAAIEEASEVLAANLEFLAQAMGPRRFWQLVADVHANHGRKRRGLDDSLEVFWSALSRDLAKSNVMWTAAEEWASVGETVLPGAKEPAEFLPLLEGLGIHVVAENLRPIVGRMARVVPTAELTLELLLDAVEAAGLKEGPFIAAELPAGLSDQKRRNLLRRLLAERVEGDAHRQRLRDLCVWLTTRRTYDSLQGSYLVDRDTPAVFAGAIDYPLIVGPAQDAACQPLLELGDFWGLDAAVSTLKDEDLEIGTRQLAVAVLEWLDPRRDGLTEAHVTSLGDVACLPTNRGLQAPRASMIAGGFHDILQIAGEIEGDVQASFGALVGQLGVVSLGFKEYLQRFLAQACERGLTFTQAFALLRTCVEQRRIVDADTATRELLTSQAWVPCADERLRAPGACYFGTPVVREVLGDSVPLLDKRIESGSGEADLLRALGARDTPGAQAVVGRIRAVAGGDVDAAAIASVVRILQHLSTIRAEHLAQHPYSALRTLSWLPEVDSLAWAAPSELYLTRENRLFKSTGRFIAIPGAEQEKLRPVLAGLGVHSGPRPEHVVGHLLNEINAGELADPASLRWLTARAEDDAIEPLCDVAWVRSGRGDVYRARDIYLLPHELEPHLPVVDAGLRQFEALLSRLGTKARPDGEDAKRLLVRLAQEEHANGVVPAPVRQAIRRCWSLLSQEQTDVAELSHQSVALGADNRLYRCSEVLLNNAPAIASEFDDATRARFIKSPDGLTAMRAAGLRDLEDCVQTRVVELGDSVSDLIVEERLLDRRPLLAQIISYDGGNWKDVIEFASRLTVDTRKSVTVERYLDGFDAPATPSKNVAVYHDGDGHLIVAIPAGKPDWFEIAVELREILCPDSVPAVSAAFETAISLADRYEAARRVSKIGYPELDREQWKDVEQAMEEQRQRAEEEAALANVDGAEASDETDAEITEDDHGAEFDGHEDFEETAGQDSEQERGETPAAESADQVPPEGEDRPGAKAGAGASASGGGNAGAGASDGPHRGSRAGTSHGSRGGGRGRGDGSGSGRRGKATRPGTPASSGQQRGSHNGHSKNERRGGGGGQFVSYLEPKGQHRETPGSQNVRDAIGEAGVDLVMADLEREYLGSGHRVEKMKDRQEGYDVRVCAANGMVIQYVEVKTKSGFWDLRGVWISPAQFRQAREQEDKFTLAVVEHVYEAEATIFYVDDPASDIARFCFDYGWAERANRTVSVPGALKGPASSTESADEDALSRLVRAVVDAGLPEPDAPWKDGEVELAAAWADMRVGIRAEDGDPLSEPDSWQIRQASQWTTDEIIDAVRDGL